VQPNRGMGIPAGIRVAAVGTRAINIALPEGEGRGEGEGAAYISETNKFLTSSSSDAHQLSRLHSTPESAI